MTSAGTGPTDKSQPRPAQQIGRAAIAFERQRTGHAPESVAVVMNEDTLVITVRGALSPAEVALARSPEGAAAMQEFHQQLFANASDSLKREIKRITGVDVHESMSEFEPARGGSVGVFPTGTIVLVFLLAGKVATDAWSDGEQACEKTP